MVFEYHILGRNIKKKEKYDKVLQIKGSAFELKTKLYPNHENIRRHIVHLLLEMGIVVSEIQPVEQA